jgi:hypothetical protein
MYLTMNGCGSLCESEFESVEVLLTDAGGQNPPIVLPTSPQAYTRLEREGRRCMSSSIVCDPLVECVKHTRCGWIFATSSNASVDGGAIFVDAFTLISKGSARHSRALPAYRPRRSNRAGGSRYSAHSLVCSLSAKTRIDRSTHRHNSGTSPLPAVVEIPCLPRHILHLSYRGTWGIPRPSREFSTREEGGLRDWRRRGWAWL